MTSQPKLPNPFTIRTKDGKWEVLFIDQGDAGYYVTCDSRDDAEAIADARPFNAAFEIRHRCDAAAVQRSISALERYGLSTTKLFRRLKFLLEDITNGVI